MATASGILAIGVTEILKKLSSVVANEITLVWDFNDELKNLQRTLNMILDVMEDAEKKQLSQAAVRRWMEELKAIAYDAEDILDEYSYEVILCKHLKDEEYKTTIINKVRNVFSSSKPSFVATLKLLAHKVKQINEKFHKIAKLKNDLGLKKIYLGSSSSSSDMVFLGSKKTEQECKIIRDTQLWHASRDGKKSKNEILLSLRLSYDYLPSHLKLCFSYCCLFPKDWIIERETLIRLWMAEGFLIQSPGENTTSSMEEIGNEYFHSLLSSFFFQDAEKDFDGDITTCKMHDLVHDLARSVVGKNECLIVENEQDIDYISEETRRLSLLVNLDDEEMLAKVLEALKKAKNLRTVFVCQQRIDFDFDIGNAFKENKRLRVLHLSECFASESTSIIGLLLPRCGMLDLSEPDIIPESTCSSSIGELKHLRYLGVKGVCFPKGMISRLSFLQTLSEFNLGGRQKYEMNVSVIEELEGLNLLTGDLSINHLQNVTSETNACRASLKEKKNLRGLELSWHGRSKHHANNDEAVLEGLRPHPNLRTLKIHGFGGSKLPRWIEDSSCLPNLVELTLDDGMYELAGFGALPSLRCLTLLEKKLECIGNEFYYSVAAAGGSSSSSFPSLKKLILACMYSLKEWVVPVPSQGSTTGATTNYCFPLLEEIEIYGCHRLSTITPTTTIFPSLKVLKLDFVDGSAAKTLVTNNLNSLTSLTLDRIRNLVSLPHQGLIENNNTLMSLAITNCLDFKGFLPPDNEEQQLQEGSLEVSSSSSSLQSLKLYGCPALRFYPDIRSLTSLRSLEIQECEESKSLLTCLSSSSSSLENVEHVKILKKNAARVIEEVVVFEWRKSSSFKE